MMRFTCLLFAALILGIVTSCQPNTSGRPDKNTIASEANTENEVFKNIMVVHDEVMPKMADLNRVKRNLKDWLTSNDNHPELERVSSAIQSIETAEAGMMDWMRGISEHRPETLREAGKSHEEIITVLDEELAAIEKVRDDMLSSLTTGRQLLDQLTENDSPNQ